MSISRIHLSASTSGRPILIGATASPGTVIHTATSVAGGLDSVYLWVTNTSAIDHALTIEFGGTTSPNDRIVNQQFVSANSHFAILYNIGISGGLIVRAFASTAHVLLISGNVNRILP